MPKNYIRKTKRATWDEEDMRIAIIAIRNGEMSYRQACETFCVPRGTLERHVKGTNQKKAGSARLGRETLMSEKHEDDLVQYIFAFEARGFPLTKSDILDITFQFCQRLGIEVKFRNGKASQDWWLGFRKRHPQVTIRKPQGLSIARVIHMNKPTETKFFELLEEVYNKYRVFGKPGHVYNTDESGLSLVPGVKAIVGRLGKKDSNQITSGERGQLITVMICCNAAGDFIPPTVVYKGKRLPTTLFANLPPSTLVLKSDTGYMNRDLFLLWLQHFAEHKQDKDQTSMLVIDGHKSHTMSMEVIEFAKSHHIELVSFPPHTSHVLQPMDIVFYKPLKEYFRDGVRKYMRNNPGKPFTRNEFPAIFKDAYFKVATVHNAVTSFASTGLYPLDMDVIHESAYIPSQTTDVGPAVARNPLEDLPAEPTTDENPDASNELDGGETEEVHVLDDPVETNGSSDDDMNEDIQDAEADVDRADGTQDTGGQISNDSFRNHNASFYDVLPLPKASRKTKVYTKLLQGGFKALDR